MCVTLAKRCPALLDTLLQWSSVATPTLYEAGIILEQHSLGPHALCEGDAIPASRVVQEFRMLE